MLRVSQTLPFAAIAFLVSVAGAQAMTIARPCTDNDDYKAAHSAIALTGVSACEVGTDSQDFVKDPLQVNKDTLFGHDDWVFSGRDNNLNDTVVDEGNNGLGFSLSGDLQNGTWSVSEDLWKSAQEAGADIMLVFKSGNGDPDRYVGYVLSDWTGVYQSPFRNPKNDNLKDISHVSAYWRAGDAPWEPAAGDVPSVPLPAGAWLLLSGLGGLMIARRRKA